MSLHTKLAYTFRTSFCPLLPRNFQTFWRGEDGNAGIFGISCDTAFVCPDRAVFLFNPDRAFFVRASPVLEHICRNLGKSVNAASDT
jgi:hypothetical protein